MTFDLTRLRADTPSLEHRVHLLASGASPMPDPVLNAIKNHLDLEAAIGGYEAHAERADQLGAIYPLIAEFIHADCSEIAILENATAAWCQVFYAMTFEPGDRILTCEAEYAANYVAFLQRQKRDGIIIDIIPSDQNGALDTQAMESMIEDRTVLIAITWIPTNGGLVNPAERVGQIAKKNNIPYLLDACQAIGQMPVNVKKLQCDFLSATGRKFLRGPRGTGFLYIRKALIKTLEPPMIDHFAAPWVEASHYQLRDDARRFENWENAYALRAGLGAAVEYVNGIGLDVIQERSWGLAASLREKLSSLSGARVYDLGSEQCAIVSFSIEGLAARETVAQLRMKGINIGASDPASTRLDAEARSLPTLLRAAPHYYNTESELDQLVLALEELKHASHQ